jgi:hypothetical protein
VCLLLFSSSALGPIYLLLKIDAWSRASHTLCVHAMHVLSSQWAHTVHYLERFITPTLRVSVQCPWPRCV